MDSSHPTSLSNQTIHYSLVNPYAISIGTCIFCSLLGFENDMFIPLWCFYIGIRFAMFVVAISSLLAILDQTL